VQVQGNPESETEHRQGSGQAARFTETRVQAEIRVPENHYKRG